MQYLRYILWAAGAFCIFIGVDDGQPNGIINGIILVLAGSFTKIKSILSDYSSSKAQDELLKLKALLDQDIITQEEYNKKSNRLKEKL
jgi:hypothetical protein